MYKPNFCSECGSRIERRRWHLWTSRKFCLDCAPRFRKAQFLLPIILGTTLFGLGLAAGRAARPAPPPLIIERGQLPSINAASQIDGEQAGTTLETEKEGATVRGTEPAYGPDGTSAERPTQPDEVVTLCGARTQKGTPCRRRVRGTGRCWQHKGLPS